MILLLEEVIGRYDLPYRRIKYAFVNSLEKLSKLPEETVVYNGHTWWKQL